MRARSVASSLTPTSHRSMATARSAPSERAAGREQSPLQDSLLLLYFRGATLEPSRRALGLEDAEEGGQDATEADGPGRGEGARRQQVRDPH